MCICRFYSEFSHFGMGRGQDFETFCIRWSCPIFRVQRIKQALHHFRNCSLARICNFFFSECLRFHSSEVYRWICCSWNSEPMCCYSFRNNRHQVERGSYRDGFIWLFRRLCCIGFGGLLCSRMEMDSHLLYTLFFYKHQLYKHRQSEIWPIFLREIGVPIDFSPFCLC